MAKAKGTDIDEGVDPITMVYEALWGLLEDTPAFTNAVLEGNRIKFDGSRYNRDTSVEDLPQVQIVSVATAPHIQRTSSSSTLVKRWDVQVTTGSMYLEALNELDWIIYRALAQWHTRLTSLQWNDKSYVTLLRPTATTDTVPADRSVQAIGWRSVWSVEVEMVFRTDDLAY